MLENLIEFGLGVVAVAASLGTGYGALRLLVYGIERRLHSN